MPDLTLTIGGRPYTVSCAPGQEGRVGELAAQVDARVGEIVRSGAATGEAQALVLAALMLADEAEDARAAAAGVPAPDPATLEAQAAAARALSEIAGQIHSVAGRLKDAV